ncbi:Hypothetical protein A7982_10397 [Minicystis rosea]|nr:Hypothetical protein A7982_10397 [Minicystis rosea]
MTKNGASPLEIMILARLLVKGDGETPTEIGKALKTILQNRWTDAERTRAIDEQIEAFSQARYIEPCKRKSYKLTDGGRKAALKALKVPSFEEGTRWDDVKRHHLFCRALDLEASDEVLGADVRRTEVLARHYGITRKNVTLNDIKHAVAWRLLGFETDLPLGVEAIMAAVFNRALGHDWFKAKAKDRLDSKRAFAQLATKAMSARRGMGAIDNAILGRWVQGVDVVPTVTHEKASVPSTPDRVTPVVELPVDDDVFAMRVLDAARTSETGRFGADKVFISHVVKQLTKQGVSVGDIKSFKDRLVSVHRKQLLSLTRADLVEAMDPRDVDASEAPYLNATFHFVRI